MSGNYPDGFTQRDHDEAFDRLGPDPREDAECGFCADEGCERCGEGYVRLVLSEPVTEEDEDIKF